MVILDIIDKVYKSFTKNRYIDRKEGNPVTTLAVDILVVVRIFEEAVAPL